MAHEQNRHQVGCVPASWSAQFYNEHRLSFQNLWVGPLFLLVSTSPQLGPGVGWGRVELRWSWLILHVLGSVTVAPPAQLWLEQVDQLRSVPQTSSQYRLAQVIYMQESKWAVEASAHLILTDIC